METNLIVDNEVKVDNTMAIVNGKVVEVDPNDASAPPVINTEPTAEDKKVNKVIEKELRDEKNVFDVVIGPGYGSRLAQVFNANIVDRFWLMGSVVSYADQDKDLTESKKKLVHDLEDVFYDACCADGPSKRLNAIISNNPNLVKMVRDNRINRVYDTIDIIPHRLGFHTAPGGKYIPVFFSTMAVCYGWNGLEQSIKYQSMLNRKNYVGELLAALLAKYANGLNPIDYVNMWFVLMFIKNLSVCSITQKEVFETNPEIKTYADNLFSLVDRMIDTCCIELRNIAMLNPSDDKKDLDPNTPAPKDENDNIVEIEV